MLLLKKPLILIFSEKNGAKWNFPKNKKNMSWGQNAKNGLILKKVAVGSHFRGQMLNFIAQKSTDTNFEFKEW